MPPIRSQPNAKPMKTERTHEENQERAYIAASRRSDRSLEARIESARRASEIHKKRTGRGLRVTEQDVVNEEMYEEEEEDMPHHYRRLQAMMVNMANTGQIFDGRLNSYMIGSLGTRAMMMNGLGMPPQLHAPTPFFPYTPPQAATPAQVQSSLAAHAAAPVHMPYSPAQYTGQQHGVQSLQRTPSPSSAEGQTSGQDTQKKLQNPRRKSASQMSPNPHSSDARSSLSPTSSGQQSVHQSPTQRNYSVDPSQNQQTYGAQQQFAYPNAYSAYDPTMGMGMGNLYGGNFNLLSPNLPVEAQQMLGTDALNPSDLYTSFMMDQGHGMPIPTHGLSYSYNPNFSPTSKQRQASNGINQTLSQSPFVQGHKATKTNNSHDVDGYGSPPISTTDMDSTSYSSTFNFEPFGLDQAADGARTPVDTFYPDFFDCNGGQGQHI